MRKPPGRQTPPFAIALSNSATPSSQAMAQVSRLSLNETSGRDSRRAWLVGAKRRALLISVITAGREGPPVRELVQSGVSFAFVSFAAEATELAAWGVVGGGVLNGGLEGFPNILASSSVVNMRLEGAALRRSGKELFRGSGGRPEEEEDALAAVVDGFLSM